MTNIKDCNCTKCIWNVRGSQKCANDDISLNDEGKCMYREDAE